MAGRAKPAEKRSRAWLLWSCLAGAALVAWGARSLTKDSSIGAAALQEVNAVVSLGPRPVGSDAHAKTERLILDKLKSAGIAIEEDRFTADTPLGPQAMNNIIGRVAGRGGASQRSIILATHYDTKIERNFSFVGANDGGSGTGLRSEERRVGKECRL